MSASTSPPLRPQFFVTRQNGAMVPLIAADELPSDVVIRDVSRNLSPHDVSGMTAVGSANARHRQYVIQPPDSPFTRSRAHPDHPYKVSQFAHSDDCVPSMSEFRPLVSLGNTFPGPPKAFGIEEQIPSTVISPAPVYNGPLRVDRKAVPASLPPWHNIEDLPLKQAPGMKEYCSYWLRHGECDYAQQGCLYKHEMPLDRVVLERLGLRDIPRWYREKHGLGSYLAGSGTISTTPDPSTKLDAMLKNWRSRSAEVGQDSSSRKEPVKDDGALASPAAPSITRARPDRVKSTPVDTRKPGLGFGHRSRSDVHRSRSDVQRSDPPPRFYPRAPAIISAPAPAPKQETLRGRQTRETLKALDAYEQQERDRKALADKYKILEPVKRDSPKPSIVLTPTTSSGSMDGSSSGGSSGSSLHEEESPQASPEPRSSRMTQDVRLEEDDGFVAVKLESRSGTVSHDIRLKDPTSGMMEMPQQQQQQQQQQQPNAAKRSRRHGGRRDGAGAKEGKQQAKGKHE